MGKLIKLCCFGLQHNFQGSILFPEDSLMLKCRLKKRGNEPNIAWQNWYACKHTNFPLCLYYAGINVGLFASLYT